MKSDRNVEMLCSSVICRIYVFYADGEMCASGFILFVVMSSFRVTIMNVV